MSNNGMQLTELRAAADAEGVRRTRLTTSIHGFEHLLADADLKAIEDLQRQWLAFEAAGATAELVDLCTEDVIWMPPTEPAFRGRSAIQAWLDRPSARIEDVQLSNVRIDGDGAVAYKSADYQTRYVPAGSEPAVASSVSHSDFRNSSTQL